MFLDFDGVVNTPIWNIENDKYTCKFAMPSDNKVNNFQAVQWVSDFCQKYDYKIVVTSTWRYLCDYVLCLKNGGLREGIEILGSTSIMRDKQRGDEISKYLEEHQDVENYIIFDDDMDMTVHADKLIKCDAVVGFTMNEFKQAERLHKLMVSV